MLIMLCRERNAVFLNHKTSKHSQLRFRRHRIQNWSLHIVVCGREGGFKVRFFRKTAVTGLLF